MSSATSSSTPANPREGLRRRSSSVSQAVNQITSPSKGNKVGDSKVEPAKPSFFKEIYTMRWMTSPVSSAKIASVFIIGYVNWRIFTPNSANPFEHFLFISHKVPVAQVLLAEPQAAMRGDTVRYQKGYWDIAFLLFYVVVFSFIRQVSTLYIWKPLAQWWGIKNETKQIRLMEQGYSWMYWGSASIYGLYVMSFQESWWYKLEHLWLKYPHWLMRPELKIYYLLQSSYWLQQALVMLLKLEKPRKDYYELVAHHLVTLWLIGWSYLINLTMIGTTVFVCMDVPDSWLAMSKILNYLGLDKVASVVFVFFIGTWTYFRIYLSARTLWSVWYDFDTIPSWTRYWNPQKGIWLVSWMKYQVFTPLFLLLLLNIFWYFLMWRVMYRIVRGHVSDEREEGEFDEEPNKEGTSVAPEVKKGKKKNK